MSHTATPLRVEVYKDGNLFIGDLVFSNGDIWKAWQVFRTMAGLRQSAACTFDGPVVRVDRGVFG